MTGIALAFLGGLAVGLITNYLADVLPRSRRLTAPVCLNCGNPRTITEFIQGADCKSCGKIHKTRFWIVLAVSLILSVGVWLKPVENLPFWASIVLLILFSTIVITDLEYRVILEQVSFTGYIICAVAGWLLHGVAETVLGGLTGLLLFLVLYYAGKLFARRLSKNRKEPIDEEALGFGDVHLAGIIGLISGFPFVFTALLAAIILGGVISAGCILIALARKQYQAFQAIPYGPFIILGGIIALYMY